MSEEEIKSADTDTEAQVAIEKLKRKYGENLIPKSEEPKPPLDSHAEAITKLQERQMEQRRRENSRIAKLREWIKKI